MINGYFIYIFLKYYLHYFAVVSKFRSPWIFKFFSLISPLSLLFVNESRLHLLMPDKILFFKKKNIEKKKNISRFLNVY